MFENLQPELHMYLYIILAALESLTTGHRSKLFKYVSKVVPCITDAVFVME